MKKTECRGPQEEAGTEKEEDSLHRTPEGLRKERHLGLGRNGAENSRLGSESTHGVYIPWFPVSLHIA